MECSDRSAGTSRSLATSGTSSSPEGTMDNDPLPYILGNEDVKAAMLWAMARYDPEALRKIVPFILVGKSGEGKTAILESIRKLYPSRIYSKDGLTEASLAQMKMSDKILLIDELSKWSSSNLGALITLFGASVVERARKVGSSRIVANGL